MLKRLPADIEFPLELFKPFPKLPVPQTKMRYRVETETWVLASEPPHVTSDFLPRVSIGFFRKSGFYPDFILWIRNKKTKEVVVRFIDPHGMHHGGLPGNSDKIEALKDLQEISKERVFAKKKVRLDGFILTTTELRKIPGAEELSWEKLKSDYGIMRQEGEYCEGVLGV